MINLLRQYGWSLFFCIVCLSLGFSFGQAVTKASLTPQITAAERALSEAQFAFVQAQKNAADLNNLALREAAAKQQALNTTNEQLTAELYATTYALAQAKQQHDRSIPNALGKDGKTFTGIGSDSLRVYTAALGYTSDNRVPTATERPDTHPPQTPTANIGESRSTADARESLRGMEPESGKQADGHPAVAANQPGIK
ncbi:hypothetical protein [Yersinia pseudotuberculosis]|uniref:hypothetical protein n=1 Tax=Yersinia pseudotuberculosis TaxID=633 RepID=UPI000F6E5453|nr:hypothetical protein [Yersinia pseudotuberculosis]MBK1426442.1 hypothetical protein [Yersinia pseudotuberculosis]VEE73904.1 Uncharacterised protein [Yersinia pseudotuberculosis]